MKKYIIILISTLFLSCCSFDNKSGIWKGDQEEVKTKSLKYSLLALLLC